MHSWWAAQGRRTRKHGRVWRQKQASTQQRGGAGALSLTPDAHSVVGANIFAVKMRRCLLPARRVSTTRATTHACGKIPKRCSEWTSWKVDALRCQAWAPRLPLTHPVPGQKSAAIAWPGARRFSQASRSPFAGAMPPADERESTSANWSARRRGQQILKVNVC